MLFVVAYVIIGIVILVRSIMADRELREIIKNSKVITNAVDFIICILIWPVIISSRIIRELKYILERKS